MPYGLNLNDVTSTIIPYRALSDHSRHAVLANVVTCLPIALHGNDAGKMEVGIQVILVAVASYEVSSDSRNMERSSAHVSRKIPSPVK
jgi:hypothetical protein